MIKNIKKLLNKDTIKIIAKEGAQLGVETATAGARGFISDIFYKIIFIIILIAVVTIGGCVGTELIVDKFTNKPVATQDLKTQDK